jgi:flagellar hook-associated protein 2
MPGISSPGIGSGLDVTSIVTSLMNVERVPLTLLQSEASKITTKVSAWGKIQSQLASLQDASRALLNTNTFEAAKATSADETKVKVTSSTGATAGNYEVTVTRLAQRQSLTSASISDASSAVGDGAITFALGSAGVGGFVADSARTPVSVAIPSGATLAQVRDAINGASAGVTASVITDLNGSRLSLKSKDSGANQAFEVSVVDNDGNNSDALGLSRLSYSFTASSAMTTAQSAGNAELSIDGVAITSASNTVTGAVDGVTFQLLTTTTSAVSIAVIPDTGSMTQSVQAFVDSYNNLNKTLAESLKYDDTTKRGGPLQGDRSATQLQAQLREMLRAGVGTSSPKRLSDIGIELQRDGSLKLNTTKLDGALSVAKDVASFFQNKDPMVSENVGLARRMDKRFSEWLGSDGAVSGASATLSKRIKANQDQQSAVSRRLEIVQNRLLKTYSALDQQLAQLRSIPIPSSSTNNN